MSRISLDTPYYPVSISKFIIMGVLTIGIYQFFWFIANWHYVQLKENKKILPTVRAIFSHITYFMFIHYMSKDQGIDKKLNIGIGWVLGVLIIIFNGIYMSADNEVVMLIVNFLTILCFVPLLYKINQNTVPHHPQYIENSKYRIHSILAIIILTPFLLLSLLTGLHFIPAEQIIKGGSLWNKDLNYIKNNGFLEKNEKLGYFYSSNFFSIKDSGSLYTDQKILDYWLNDEGELISKSIKISDIKNINFSTEEKSGYKILEITMNDNSEYEYWLPTDNNRHKKVSEFIKWQMSQ